MEPVENSQNAETAFSALLGRPFTPDGYQELIRLADEVGMTAVWRIVQEPAPPRVRAPQHARAPARASVDLDDVYANWRLATARRLGRTSK